jgi:hypothetical protein
LDFWRLHGQAQATEGSSIRAADTLMFAKESW